MLMRGKFAGAASEAIMIELKERGAGTPANITLDPVKLDPKHYQVIIDNDRVRVLRARADFTLLEGEQQMLTRSRKRKRPNLASAPQR